LEAITGKTVLKSELGFSRNFVAFGKCSWRILRWENNANPENHKTFRQKSMQGYYTCSHHTSSNQSKPHYLMVKLRSVYRLHRPPFQMNASLYYAISAVVTQHGASCNAFSEVYRDQCCHSESDTLRSYRVYISPTR